MAVLDGGLATQLEQYGAILNDDPLWSAKCIISNPELVQRVHVEYLNAGADIITTATYQASTDLLEKRGMTQSDEQQQFYRTGVQLAKQAIDEFLASKLSAETEASEQHALGNEPVTPAVAAHLHRPLIAFSVGSFGASLGGGKEYGGDYGIPIAQIIKFHKKRLRLVSQLEDIDLIAFETIPCRREAIAIITLLKEFPKLRCWLSFSCRNDEEIADGTPIVNILKLVNSSKQIISVGVNCTSPDFISSLVKKMVCRTTKVVIAYPNKGQTSFLSAVCPAHVF
jgi:homocysteine S-methyltransferase